MTRPRRDAPASPRWSASRVGLALLIVLCLSGGGALGIRDHLRTEPRRAATWYAPYVDVTVTPGFAFEDPTVNPAADVVLAFVVADPEEPCRPSWGAAYDLDAAATGLDLDRRIARYRQRGGDVIVSFGGVAHDELAVACTDEEELAEAYRSVISRYDVTTVDVDIEGPALADRASITRRAHALASVQSAARRTGRDLSVWLTLPVTPSGLDAAGVAVVAAMLDARVDLGGVNVMTMSFGSSRPPGTDLQTAVEGAVEATHGQLDATYGAAGLHLDSTTLWGKVGATPMLGVNDAVTDVFTLADARALRRLAIDRGLGRVSTWSANRDAPCAPRAVTTELSNHCSGVAQPPRGFGDVFGALAGRPRDGADRRTAAAVTVPPGGGEPGASPYPPWDAEAAYPEGTKIVRRGQVFAAQWWTQGDDPVADPADGQPSPWHLVGPVLESDQPVTTSTLPAGALPAWHRDETYREGDRVLLHGIAYEARWWTQGDDPSGPGDGTEPNPWTRVAAPG